MSKGSLYERLRAATRPLHDELERAVNIEVRLKSRTRYVEHLTALWRLHVAAERSLQDVDFEPLGFAYPYPYRSALLEEDLARLGVSRAVLERIALPTPLMLNSVPAGLGCLYVVEGSAKGARAILPNIKAALALDPDNGARFFYGFGRETGQLWHAFLGAINAIEADSPAGDVAVKSAIETFVMFHEGLLAAQTTYTAAMSSPDPRMPQDQPRPVLDQSGP